MNNYLKVFVFCLIGVLYLPSIKAQNRLQPVIYVSSSEGNDANDGLSPNSPLKTIKAGVAKGEKVLLKAGDVFYESLYATDRTVSRYGKGHNPSLIGYKRLVEPRWEMVDKNIWKISLAEDNFTGYNEVGPSLLNNIGCIHEYDKDLIHGCRREFYKELTRDWDFWQTEHHERNIDPNELNYVYLYLSKNPNELKLEFAVSEFCAYLERSTVEHINFYGFGYGVECKNKTNVRFCRVDAMGGRIWLGQKDFGRLGNGIEFYVSQDMEDCTIEGNYITRCYDCGITIQAYNCGKATPRNFTVKDNLIMNCCQGWEDFLRNDPDVVFENCVFKNNVVLNSGESGFTYPETRVIYCHVLGYNSAGDKGMQFENNVFAKGNYFIGAPYNKKYRSNVWRGNKCYISPGSNLISHFRGKQDVVSLKGNLKESVNEIAQYRDLTNDQTTKFVVLSEKKMERKVKQLQKKYLRSHSY